MLEVFQGTGVPTLLPPHEYDVEDELAKWLVENGKAVAVEQIEQAEQVTVVDEVPEPEPIPADKPEQPVQAKKKPRGRK